MSEAFDYIVVGAGSAGCALAARLSEDAGVRVLLVEAGGRDWSPVIHVPAGVVRAIGNPRLDWAHLAEPDPSRGGKVDLWPAGKVLGGSSSINGMLFVRGAPADFDRWAALGNPGWSYAELLPAFRRMERFSGGESQWRGQLGPVCVEGLRTTHRLAADFFAAAVEAGLAPNPDYNGERQDGVAKPQATQRRGARWSAARAYLAPARRRSNLSIVTGATVERILFDGRQASGVAYRRGGQAMRAGARREVIVSAGALASPKLLTLSGIGPGDELERLGIEALAPNDAIGRNLAEHPNANMSWDVRPRTYNVELGGARAALHMLNWALFRRGPATSPYPHAVAFFRTAPGLASPDIQLMFGPFAFAFSPEGVVPYRKPAVTVVAALNYPKARGRVRLRSPDPADPLIIEHALLSEPEDVARLTAAGRFVRHIFAQPPLQRDVIGERLPGPAVASDPDWDAYLRRTTFLGYHPVGTCAMGPSGGVDERLRVRGVERLRVADASVMPHPISGNTNAAAIMIGERAAELIREDSRG